MCGIAGIITIKNSKIDSTVVENVKRSLEHRGPDHSSHQFIKESVCLIHTRLSIIDLNDRSNQPFQSKDERYSHHLIEKADLNDHLNRLLIIVYGLNKRIH